MAALIRPRESGSPLGLVDQAARRKRRRSRSILARPYMERLSSLRRELAGRHGGRDGVGIAHELAVAMTLHAAAEHSAVQNVNDLHAAAPNQPGCFSALAAFNDVWQSRSAQAEHAGCSQGSSPPRMSSGRGAAQDRAKQSNLLVPHQ